LRVFILALSVLGILASANVAKACPSVWHAPIRFEDAQWAKMEPLCLGKLTDPARTGGDNRLFLEAVLWIARTGSPWRDLPPTFGNWNTVFKRYRDWVQAGLFRRIFDAVSDDPDMEFAMVDATIVKVHRHGQGAKGGLRARL
jgi:transposase